MRRVLWLLFIFGSIVMAKNAESQSKDPFSHPFTDNELFQAYRVGASEEWARQMVADHRRNLQLMREAFARARPAEGSASRDGTTHGGLALGFMFDDATLAILSLLGPQTAAKVERFRAEQSGPREPDADAEAKWQRLREEWRPLVEQMRR